MKHAILILAHKGIDYIKDTINQFGNYQEFSFYIHIDKKCGLTTENIMKLYEYDKRVKYVASLYSCNYLKFDLIEAEIHLLEIARKNNNDYYHLFSEQCRLICSPEYFLAFFETNKDIEFIVCKNAKCDKWEKWRIYDEKINHIYFGQQWWSLSNEAINMIFNNKLKSYIKYYRNNLNECQAADEVFFQNLICEHENDLSINYENDLRYVDWTRPLIEGMHPRTIVEYNDELQNNINDKLIVRKIDFKNPKSIDVLNKLRNSFNNHEIKRC